MEMNQCCVDRQLSNGLIWFFRHFYWHLVTNKVFISFFTASVKNTKNNTIWHIKQSFSTNDVIPKELLAENVTNEMINWKMKHPSGQRRFLPVKRYNFQIFLICCKVLFLLVLTYFFVFHLSIFLFFVVVELYAVMIKFKDWTEKKWGKYSKVKTIKSLKNIHNILRNTGKNIRVPAQSSRYKIQ